MKKDAWWGTGSNDRTAARLRNCQWERCEFEDLVAGDLALFFEKDGTAVHQDGCYTVYIAETPTKNSEGKWSLQAYPTSYLAKYNPSKKVDDT